MLDPQGWCSTFGGPATATDNVGWTIAADYNDGNSVYLDIIRPFTVGNVDTLSLLPTSALDMTLNYAVIPVEYLSSTDPATVASDPKVYVKGAIGPKDAAVATSKDQWAKFEILVDGAQFGFGMAASALIAYTLY